MDFPFEFICHKYNVTNLGTVQKVNYFDVFLKKKRWNEIHHVYFVSLQNVLWGDADEMRWGCMK